MSIGKNSIARAAGTATAPVKKIPAPQVSTKVAPLFMPVAVELLRPLAVENSAPSDELLRSVKKHGILVPLLIARVGEELLVLLGEHRLAVAKALHLSEVPACVIEMENEAAALRLMQEVRACRQTKADSVLNEKFYAAASVGSQEMPVFLL